MNCKVTFYVFICLVCWDNPQYSEIIFDENLSYTLNSLTIRKDGNIFYPSSFGGVALISDNKIYYPWDKDIEYNMVYHRKENNIFSSRWLIRKKDDFFYQLNVTYTLFHDKVSISFEDAGSNGLNDSVKEKYADVYAVLLNRSENSIKPVIIGVPYLTMFNILYSNDCFVSMYFDWNTTNCSQLIPYNSVYSPTSVFYSQFALYNPLSNGERNKLNETVILKVSEKVDDVFPDLNNPQSPFREESANRIVFDDWMPFNGSIERLTILKNAGISNLWHFVHDWQKYGYDVKLPDIYPANIMFGGNDELYRVAQFNKQNNYLFGLHENYIDIYKESKYYNNQYLASDNGRYKFNWFNGDSSFLVKPDAVSVLVDSISTLIHNNLITTSVFHDVASSYDPSKFVDYDYSSGSTGKFLNTYNYFKKIPEQLRNIHKGPVSGEGLAHFLYVGYYDDIAAQLHTAQSLPGSYYGQSEKEGGFYKPLFVNFDLLKMKEKAAVHGMGYYERFFYKDYYWKYHGWGRDSGLMYAATEIAFGHCAFFTTDSYDLVNQAKIENDFVYPLQKLYSDKKVKKILYYDGKVFKNASDYIRKFPYTFHDYNHSDFMSRVYIEYENGLIMYINRHPVKKWKITINKTGYYNYHAISSGDKPELYAGDKKGGVFTLPHANGWLAFYKKKII